jgi:hypothetical protein
MKRFPKSSQRDAPDEIPIADIHGKNQVRSHGKSMSPKASDVLIAGHLVVSFSEPSHLPSERNP